MTSSAPPIEQTSTSEVQSNDGGADPGRFLVGLVSLALLLAGLVGTVASLSTLKTVGLVLFAAIGLGAGALQLVDSIRGMTFAVLSLLVSLTLVLLIGLGLVEFHWWVIGVPLFIVLAAFAALSNLYGVVTNAGSMQSIIDEVIGVQGSPFPIGPVLAIVGALLSIVTAIVQSPVGLTRTSGIIGSLSPLWYVGVALVVLAVILARNSGGFQLGFTVLILALTITATPPIVMHLPFYQWTYKHIGLTKFFMVTGKIVPGAGPNNGVYMAWPALFAGVGWVSHVVGADPVGLARWWPTFIDLGWLVAARFFAYRLGLTVRQSWFAAIFFLLSVTIGQDYFSPQAIGVLFAIFIFALSFRQYKTQSPLTIAEWVILVSASCAIAATHELTSYMVSVAVVVMFLFGFVRSWIVPLVVLVPAVGWTTLHSSSLKGVLSSHGLGGVSSNLSISFNHASYNNDLWRNLTSAGQLIGVLIVGLLALTTLIRKRDRFSLMLAVASASGFGLLAVTAYGAEGFFRAVLFATPWLAVLAMSGIGLSASGADGDASEDLFGIATLILLPVIAVSYWFGAFGSSFGYANRAGDVSVLNHFEVNTPALASVVSMGYGNIPLYPTAEAVRRASPDQRLISYPFISESGQYRGHFNTEKALQELEVFMIEQANVHLYSTGELRYVPKYAYFSTGALGQSILRGVATPEEYSSLENAIASSRDWRLENRSDSAALYRLVTPDAVIQKKLEPNLRNQLCAKLGGNFCGKPVTTP